MGFSRRVCLFLHERFTPPKAAVHWVFVLPRSKYPKEATSVRNIMWFIQSSALAGFTTSLQLNVKLRAEAQQQKNNLSLNALRRS